MDELSEMVQSLYQTMNEKFARLKLSSDEHGVLEFMLKLEDYLCDRIYTRVFCTK